MLAQIQNCSTRVNDNKELLGICSGFGELGRLAARFTEESVEVSGSGMCSMYAKENQSTE